MLAYSMVFAKLGLGLLALIFQINVFGKGNLAPNSALDQIQNYVLGALLVALFIMILSVCCSSFSSLSYGQF